MTASNTAAVPGERAAFEAHFANEGWDGNHTFDRYDTYPKEDSVYKSRHVADMWSGWKARAALSQPAAAPLSGWISVDERLPAKGEHVIAYRPTAKLTQDDEIRILRYKDCATESWQGVVHGFEGICHPTHWMPVPTAPGAEAAPDDLAGAQFAAKSHLQTVQVQADALAALEVERDLLSASLKQSDAERDKSDAVREQLVAALKYARRMMKPDCDHAFVDAALAAAGAKP